MVVLHTCKFFQYNWSLASWQGWWYTCTSFTLSLIKPYRSAWGHLLPSEYMYSVYSEATPLINGCHHSEQARTDKQVVSTQWPTTTITSSCQSCTYMYVGQYMYITILWRRPCQIPDYWPIWQGSVGRKILIKVQYHILYYFGILEYLVTITPTHLINPNP